MPAAAGEEAAGNAQKARRRLAIARNLYRFVMSFLNNAATTDEAFSQSGCFNVVFN
jgi:hypothetical protein